MSSVIEIYNNALYLLGDDGLTSETEISKKAMLCNAFYPGVRDAVLRAHPWNFAQVRAALAQLSETPEFGYTYVYQLPTDPYCLRVLEAEDNDEIEYKIEGRKILTDEGSIKILYVARIEDPNEFDSLFIEAVGARLAMKLAFPITGDKVLADSMWKLYQVQIQEAKTIDGMEGTPKTYTSNDLIEVRY